MRDRAQDEHLGVTGTNKAKLEWNKLEAHRRKVLETRGDMALKTDKGVKIDYIQGFGQFVDEHTLVIDTSGNSDDPHRAYGSTDSQRPQEHQLRLRRDRHRRAAVRAADSRCAGGSGQRRRVDIGHRVDAGRTAEETRWSSAAVPSASKWRRSSRTSARRSRCSRRRTRILAEVEPEIAESRSPTS